MIGDCYPICTLLSTCLKFLGSTVTEIWRGSKISKVDHVNPFRPLWPNFAFLLVPLVVHMRAKFEFSSSNRSRDMEGLPKFQKYVT